MIEEIQWIDIAIMRALVKRKKIKISDLKRENLPVKELSYYTCIKSLKKLEEMGIVELMGKKPIIAKLMIDSRNVYYIVDAWRTLEEELCKK